MRFTNCILVGVFIPHQFVLTISFDEQERIIYIYGLTFEISGILYPWSELYSFDELNLFETALN